MEPALKLARACDDKIHGALVTCGYDRLQPRARMAQSSRGPSAAPAWVRGAGACAMGGCKTGASVLLGVIGDETHACPFRGGACGSEGIIGTGKAWVARASVA